MELRCAVAEFYEPVEMFRRQTFESGDEADIRLYIREKIAEVRD